ADHLRKFHQDLTAHVLPICLPHGKGCSATRTEEFASSNCHERSLQRGSAQRCRMRAGRHLSYRAVKRRGRSRATKLGLMRLLAKATTKRPSWKKIGSLAILLITSMPHFRC